ncbi:MAG: glycoside hydrolase family 2 protein [Planctomycetota bacterium]
MTSVMDVPASLNADAAPYTLGTWSCSAHRPGEVTQPQQLINSTSEWLPAEVPSTVASVLNSAGRWSFEEPTDIDAQDWWFRTTFQAPKRAGNAPRSLCFDGLATLAEVWLNGALILTADNMFRAYRVDVSETLEAENELAIRFRSVAEELKKKRPRPRWKTNLIAHQQLRWHRATLQGRIPGWSPTAQAIGPWRDIRLECAPVSLHEVHLQTTLIGTTGVVSLHARVATTIRPDRVLLKVSGQLAELAIQSDAEGFFVSGELQIESPLLWWPHTHGRPELHLCEVVIESGGEPVSVYRSDIGFRQLEVQTTGEFGISVNGQPIYCRGACWTVSDLLTLTGTSESLLHDLRLARDAGINMLRVGGTMTYESDRFYRLCDELGILVWQDFMFANMDYPVDDPNFKQNVTEEATQQVRRLAAHPCVAVYCGNSEIEQQAAMLGMPRDLWRNSWFGEDLPALCAANHPGTAYVPSTPSGGGLPFHTSSGVTHYYGVGAYLRSPGELRQADVKFTPECLGFANIPDPQTVDQITGGALPVIHDPKWKSRVPRDTGAGWDFEDVRDHYLRELYGVDPVQLRSWNMTRYLELSRTVPGEMMFRVFAEWRSSHSRNRGGLVWFYKDLWPAAGWGVVDSNGIPKAAYYYLKRSWQNRQLTLTDEGLNGLHLHLINETTKPCTGSVEVVLLKEPNIVVARQEMAFELAGNSQKTLSADEILGSFYDVTYAYRFGPPHHDVVVVTWYDTNRQVVSEACHFIRRRDPALGAVSLEGSAEKISDTEYRVALQADRFIHSVRLSARGFLPDDNYFHLPPERLKTVTFRPYENTQSSFKLDVEALNLALPIRITAHTKSE